MTYDDDPHNNGGTGSQSDQSQNYPWLRGLVIVVIVVLIAFAGLKYISKAIGQTYDLDEYAPSAARVLLARDWIVTDRYGQVICRTPYIRKDEQIIQCR